VHKDKKGTKEIKAYKVPKAKLESLVPKARKVIRAFKVYKVIKAHKAFKVKLESLVLKVHKV
jgi:hypothetical protein